jgi:hypothetical protein
VSKTRTKTRKKNQSSQLSSTDYSDDEVMLISDGEDTKPESNQRLSASITELFFCLVLVLVLILTSEAKAQSSSVLLALNL